MKKHIVIFVEGETDEEFFKKLVAFYKETSKSEVNPCKIINLKGIGRFEKEYLQN